MTAQHPTFILLPLISFDNNNQKCIKETFFSSDIFRDKLIRDWQERGKVVSDMCVVAKQIRVGKVRTPDASYSTTNQLQEQSQEEYWIVNMSKELLVSKLAKCGFGIEV